MIINLQNYYDAWLPHRFDTLLSIHSITSRCKSTGAYFKPPNPYIKLNAF